MSSFRILSARGLTFRYYSGGNSCHFGRILPKKLNHANFALIRRYTTEKESVHDAESTNNGNLNGNADEQVKRLATKVETMEKQIQEKEQKYKDLQASYLMTLADMENLRVRTKKEVDNASHYSITKFAKDLLNVADVLETALAILPKQEKTVLDIATAGTMTHDGSRVGQSEVHKVLEEFEAGVKMTYQELLHIFKRYDVIPYEDVIGKKFDPAFHTGLFEVRKSASMKGVEADASDNDPVIIQVQKKGYKIKDRVLRPAEVGIAK